MEGVGMVGKRAGVAVGGTLAIGGGGAMGRPEVEGMAIDGGEGGTAAARFISILIFFSLGEVTEISEVNGIGEVCLCLERRSKWSSTLVFFNSSPMGSSTQCRSRCLNIGAATDVWSYYNPSATTRASSKSRRIVMIANGSRSFFKPG